VQTTYSYAVHAQVETTETDTETPGQAEGDGHLVVHL